MYGMTQSMLSLIFPIVGVLTGVLAQIDAKRRARKDQRLSSRQPTS